MEISSASSSRTTKYPQWQTVVLSGVVTLVVTVCAGILVFYLEARAPRLRYSVVEGIPIIGKSKTTLTYQLAVSNDGKSVAEEVVTRFTVPGATIEQSQVAIDQANEYAMLTSDGDLRLTVPTLNPSEIVRVSLLATSSTAKPPYQISVRGRGLTGTVNATENPSSFTNTQLGHRDVNWSFGVYVYRLYLRGSPPRCFCSYIRVSYAGDRQRLRARTIHLGLCLEPCRLISGSI